MKYKNAYKMISHDWGKVASWFAFLRAHALPWKPYPVTIDEAYSFMYWANANSMNAPAQGEQDPERMLTAMQNYIISDQLITLDKLVED